MKMYGIPPTTDSDIASGRGLKRFSQEAAPIVDRRYSVASGYKICAFFVCALNTADRR
jgi:hypothetical protein